MTDGELVRLARDGQASAFEQLARRWSPRVLAVCCARVGRGSAAEDLAQESLLRGMQHLAALEQPEKFGAWLRGIAVRVCLDWLGARGHHPQPFSALADADVDPPDGVETAAEQLEREDTRQRLLSEIQALPDDLRETILLYYFDDVTYLDLADVLGVSRATVNSRLAKARDVLARRMAFLVR